MKGVTGSKVGHTVLCPGSRHLPKTGHTNSGSRRGTALHEWVEKWLVTGLKDPIPSLPKDAQEAAARFNVGPLLAALNWGEPVAELAIAYDWRADTARELGVSIGRNYGKLKASEIALTLDYATHAGNLGVIGDLKTGTYPVPWVSDNWQMRVGALAYSRLHGLSVIQAHLWFTDQEPVHQEHVWTEKHLARFRDELRKVAKGKQLVTGAHCRWCDHYNACPEIAKTVHSIVELEPEETALTPARVAEVWPKFQAVKKAIDRVRPIFTDYVEKNGPLPLANGKQLELRPQSRVQHSAVAVINALSELAGDDVARALSASLEAAVERVLKRYPTEGVTVAKVMERVAERGGTRKAASFSVLREVNPPKQEKKKDGNDSKAGG